MSGFVRKSLIKSWLRYFVNQPLYKHYKEIDCSLYGNDEVNIGPEYQTTNDAMKWGVIFVHYLGTELVFN